MRDGFGKAILELGHTTPEVVVLTADLGESTRVTDFSKHYPERFFEVGVAEQNLIGVATGLALEGFVPYATSYATFLPGRCLDHIRISVCYNNANVKLVASHGGLISGPDGATHQMLEDIAIMRTLPNMTIVVPSDGEQAYEATLALAHLKGPAYLRLSREKTASIKKNSHFELGKIETIVDGDDVVIFSCGTMVGEALTASSRLKREGVNCAVINVHTIKPLDVEGIIRAVRHVRGVVTAEDGQYRGGLGGAIAETLARYHPIPIRYIGMDDKFGESGQPQELMRKYKMTYLDIVNAVLKVFRRSDD